MSQISQGKEHCCEAYIQVCGVLDEIFFPHLYAEIVLGVVFII